MSVVVAKLTDTWNEVNGITVSTKFDTGIISLGFFLDAFNQGLL